MSDTEKNYSSECLECSMMGIFCDSGTVVHVEMDCHSPDGASFIWNDHCKKVSKFIGKS